MSSIRAIVVDPSVTGTIDVRNLILTGGTTLYGFYLLDELKRRAGSEAARILNEYQC